MSRFFFKNTNTNESHYSDELGIHIRTMPVIPVSKRVIESHPVEGRDGSLTIDKGYYKDIIFPLEIIVAKQTGENIYNQLDTAYQWLDGPGEMSFDNYLNGRHLIVKAVDIGDLYHVMQAGGIHSITLLCEPFKYSQEEEITWATGEQYIFNPSQIEAKPIITVTGTGDIDLIVNGVITQLKNVSGYVTIDSMAMTTYKDTVNKSMDKIGPFPELKAGANTISATGTVTGIEVKTKWRWK